MCQSHKRWEYWVELLVVLLAFLTRTSELWSLFCCKIRTSDLPIFFRVEGYIVVQKYQNIFQFQYFFLSDMSQVCARARESLRGESRFQLPVGGKCTPSYECGGGGELRRGCSPMSCRFTSRSCVLPYSCFDCWSRPRRCSNRPCPPTLSPPCLIPLFLFTRKPEFCGFRHKNSRVRGVYRVMCLQ